MSLDGNYILSYDVQNYIPPTPMEKDVAFLSAAHGGEFVMMTDYEIFWSKPKWLLSDKDLAVLLADQVLERRCDGSQWRDVTFARGLDDGGKPA